MNKIYEPDVQHVTEKYETYETSWNLNPHFNFQGIFKGSVTRKVNWF